MITFKTNPKRIISIFKENISSLKSFTITDFEEDSIKLKSGQFEITVKCKKENGDTTILIDWDFKPIGNQKSTGLESVGAQSHG